MAAPVDGLFSKRIRQYTSLEPVKKRLTPLPRAVSIALRIPAETYSSCAGDT